MLYSTFSFEFQNFLCLDASQILEKGLKSPGLKSKPSKSNAAHNQSTENLLTTKSVAPLELTGRDALFLLASLLREREVRTFT